MKSDLENDLYRENLQIAPMYKRVFSHIIDFILVNCILFLMLTGEQRNNLNMAYDNIISYYTTIQDMQSTQTDNLEQISQITESIYNLVTIIIKYGFLYAIVEIVYNSVFTFLYGATIGKIITKIRVIDIYNFDKPDLKISVIRSLFKYILGSMFYFGFLTAFFDRFKQTLYDKIGHTIVINN